MVSSLESGQWFERAGAKLLHDWYAHWQQFTVAVLGATLEISEGVLPASGFDTMGFVPGGLNHEKLWSIARSKLHIRLGGKDSLYPANISDFVTHDRSSEDGAYLFWHNGHHLTASRDKKVSQVEGRGMTLSEFFCFALFNQWHYAQELLHWDGEALVLPGSRTSDGKLAVIANVDSYRMSIRDPSCPELTLFAVPATFKNEKASVLSVV